MRTFDSGDSGVVVRRMVHICPSALVSHTSWSEEESCRSLQKRCCPKLYGMFTDDLRPLIFDCMNSLPPSKTNPYQLSLSHPTAKIVLADPVVTCKTSTRANAAVRSIGDLVTTP